MGVKYSRYNDGGRAWERKPLKEDASAYIRRHREQILANKAENDRNLKAGKITKQEHKRHNQDGNAALRELAQDRRREGDE